MNTNITPTPAFEKVEPVVEKTEFDVILESYNPSLRLNTIKTIRTITSLGIKEAKDLLETEPRIILQAVSKEKAEEAKKLFESTGAKALIK